MWVSPAGYLLVGTPRWQGSLLCDRQGLCACEVTASAGNEVKGVLTSGALMSRGDASAASTAAFVTSTNVARSTGTPFNAPPACRQNLPC